VRAAQPPSFTLVEFRLPPLLLFENGFLAQLVPLLVQAPGNRQLQVMLFTLQGFALLPRSEFILLCVRDPSTLRNQLCFSRLQLHIELGVFSTTCFAARYCHDQI
jgi:hypothetical protein